MVLPENGDMFWLLSSDYWVLEKGAFTCLHPQAVLKLRTEWNVLILLMWHFVLIDIPHLCCLTHLGELYFTKPKCLVILKHSRNIWSWSSEVKGVMVPLHVKWRLGKLFLGILPNSHRLPGCRVVMHGTKNMWRDMERWFVASWWLSIQNNVPIQFHTCYTMKCYSSTAATGSQAGTFRFT